jgi:hypothetical protein
VKTQLDRSPVRIDSDRPQAPPTAADKTGAKSSNTVRPLSFVQFSPRSQPSAGEASSSASPRKTLQQLLADSPPNTSLATTLLAGSRPPPLQVPQEPTLTRRAQGPRLGGLLADERRQEEAVRAQRAQLVHSALPNGGAAMKRLKDRAARQHSNTVAELWHALRNGHKPLNGERRQAFKAMLHADVMALAKTGKMDPWVAAATMREAIVDGTLGHDLLAMDRELLLNELGEMAMQVDRIYKRLNLRITPDTLPAFTNIDVLERPQEIFNNVYEVKLKNSDGSVFDGVFKPLSKTETGGVAAATGIPKDDPQTAMRNLATVSYAKKLGFDVIVDTRLALIDTGRGVADPDLGLIMERAAHRYPVGEEWGSIWRRADVCVELTKLQLLDHLTGQGDRNHNNYFINIEPNGRAKVIGIDNDLCFGKDLTDPAGIRERNAEDFFRGTGLPDVVDTEMEHAINALTSRDIRLMLADKLSGAEIQAAIARHQGVKDHIAKLRANGQVIEPSEWGDLEVQRRLTKENSYLGRRRWPPLPQPVSGPAGAP